MNYQVIPKGDIITNFRIESHSAGFGDVFPYRMALYLPVGIILPAHSSRSLIVQITHGEPGTILIWGPLAPPSFYGLSDHPSKGDTGFFHNWTLEYWSDPWTPDYLTNVQDPSKGPLNITDVKVVDNKEIILTIKPNNVTEPFVEYQIVFFSEVKAQIQWDQEQLQNIDAKIVHIGTIWMDCP